MSTDLNDKSREANRNGADEYSYRPRIRERNAKNVRAEKKKPSEKRKPNKLWFIIPGAVILCLAAAAITYTLFLPQNSIAPNIKIAGIDVGGMKEADAKEAIGALIDENAIFEVKASDNTTQIAASDISLSVDLDATVDKAMDICKSKNIFVNSFDAVCLLFGEKNISAELIYSVEDLDKLLFDFGSSFNGISEEVQYTYTSDSLTASPGTAGQNPDVSKARTEFVSAVGLGKTSNIELTLDYAEPKLLDADEVYNEICVPAQDASYSKNDDGSISVNEHKVGVEVKKDDLKKLVAVVNEGKTATCPATITTPKKTKEMLEEKLFNKTLGTYSSDFSSSSANRAHNVSLAAESINNKVLMPNEEFSYNNTIGNPNAERGYKVAGVYENGKVSEGVGGGVCQVSSTLYSAVLYADLEVVERHNHSMTVGYVPNGQDATVSYGSIDFRFKNNTEYPVKVKAAVNGRKLTVSIVGTEYEPSRTVKISNQTVSTIAPTDNETPDASLPAGTRKVVSKGKTGYVVNTYKTIAENGIEKSSKQITTSRYKMVPNEVLVSSKAAEEQVQETQQPISGAASPSGQEKPTSNEEKNTDLNETNKSDTSDVPELSKPTQRPVTDD